MGARTLRRARWNYGHALLVGLFCAGGIAACWPAWRDIVHITLRNDESTYIAIVPLVVVWLAWVRRKRLRRCRPTGRWIGPVLIVLGWTISSFGDAFYIESFWHGGAVLVLIGCALSVLGMEVAIAFLPALVALLFLIPVPGRIREAVAIPLEAITAQITQHVLMVLGLHVERTGNVLVINGHQVNIAEACNGLRMVFALVLVSYVFAFGSSLHNSIRVLIVLISPVTAILVNVIRLIPTVYLYGYAQASVAIFFHDALGWVMLLISLGLMLSIVRVLQWALISISPYMLARE